MRQRTANGCAAVISFALVMIALFALQGEAWATGWNPPGPNTEPTTDQDQYQDQDMAQDQAQTQGQTTNLETSNVSSSTSRAFSNQESNDTTEVTVEGDSVENNSSNVVLVPNNNTENCVRVWGIAFGRDSDSAALGIPWRSKACDFEAAADDAFAAGERDLGWFWKCHNKSLYRQFDGVDKDAQIVACHDRMMADARDELIEGLQKQLTAANKRAEAAQNEADLTRRHEEVCKESLERCEEKAYGGK